MLKTISMKLNTSLAASAAIVLLFVLNFSCKPQDNTKNNSTDSLAALQSHLSENALKGLAIADGLAGTYLQILGNFGVESNTSVVAFPTTGI